MSASQSPKIHYVLNESSRHDVPGYVEVFPSLTTLLQRIDPIDVRYHQYYGYDSEGYLLDIRVDNDIGKVNCHGRSDLRNQPALQQMLRDRVEALRRAHPECVDRPEDELAGMSGRELTGYVLQVHETIENKWKSNSFVNRLIRKIATRWHG